MFHLSLLHHSADTRHTWQKFETLQIQSCEITVKTVRQKGTIPLVNKFQIVNK